MEKIGFKRPALVFIGIKIFTFIVALSVFIPFQRKPVIGHWLLQDSNSKYNLLLDIWRRWDSFQFLHVAEHGYEPTSDGITHYITTFPLFPLIIKNLTYFIGDYFISGLIFVNIAYFVSMVVLYNLVKMHYSEPVAFRTILFMGIYPLSFLFSMVYSESVFLMFSVLAFYFAYKEKWIMASVFGFCAAATRIVGVVLFVPLVLIYLDQIKYNIKNIRTPILSILLVPLGLCFVFFLHYLYSGNFLIYFEMAKRVTLEPSFPWTSIKNTIQTIINYAKKGQFSEYAIIQLFSCFMILAVFIVGIKKIKNMPYLIYSILMLLLLLCSNNLFSFQRYSIVLFPMFIILAIIADSWKFNTLYCCACIPLFVYFLYRYENWYAPF